MTVTDEPTACTGATGAGIDVDQCAAFRAMLDSVVVHDADDHRVLAANPVLVEWLRTPAEELKGRDFFELFGPDGARRLREGFTNGSGGPSGELRLTCPDGDRWVLLRSRRNSFAHGSHWVTTLRDVTERKQAHEQSLAARAEAEQAHRRRSEYIAAISHELRTPMSGILGMSSLLLEGELPRDQREYVETIQSTAESLVGLLNEILDLAKIDRGHFQIDHTTFSPRDVCTSAIRLLRSNAGSAGIDLRFETEGVLPGACTGDPVRLGQVLVNLLGNALKFTHSGHVVLRVHGQPDDADHVRLRFEIEDTGIGIEPDVLPRVFEPFAQARGSSGSAYGGTGLGLAISQKLVEMMGSRIEVRSEVGRGSVFWFELGMETSGTAREMVDAGEGDVLYVGRPGDRRQAFVEALDTAGLSVEICELSSAALDRIRARRASDRPYRLVLVEQQLPDLDGETFGRSVRNRLRDSDTPLAMVASEQRPVAPERAERSGFEHVVRTPGDATGLVDPGRGEHDGSATPDPEAAPETPANDDPAVLVVEDNPVNQKVVCHMLRKMGFTVELADHGEAGVEMLGQGAFDAVLMDCQMPVMDGYEATRAIRALDDSISRIPIIALTANAMDGDREKCLAAGMDDYLSKPAKADQLREMLQKWIPVRSAAGSDPR